MTNVADRTKVPADNNESKPPKKRKRSKKLVICLVVLLLIAAIGGAGYAGLQMLTGPAEGTIMNALPPEAPKTPPVELEQYDGTYISFVHPNTYELQPPNKDDTNSLETHTFIASGMMNKILTVTVTKLPSGKLEDDASYYMRSLHPETYQLKPQTLQGEKVVVALNQKDSQQSAFWVHKSTGGNKLLTFTLSSVSINSAATANEYQKMLESVRWR